MSRADHHWAQLWHLLEIPLCFPSGTHSRAILSIRPSQADQRNVRKLKLGSIIKFLEQIRHLKLFSGKVHKATLERRPSLPGQDTETIGTQKSIQRIDQCIICLRQV
mmetsp:Transcript_13846/g.28917  ORF Transcript_13846/g.28917 Transcript_13846/m.28917 type:complete len:107 (-) Transcript_13846:287-607(-)